MRAINIALGIFLGLSLYQNNILESVISFALILILNYLNFVVKTLGLDIEFQRKIRQADLNSKMRKLKKQIEKQKK